MRRLRNEVKAVVQGVEMFVLWWFNGFVSGCLVTLMVLLYSDF